MDVEAPPGLLRFFDELDEPRMGRTKLHSLSDIPVITICAVICGANEWTEIEIFVSAKLEWLRTFLHLPRGIASHDTFGRVFSRLNPDQLERCFQKWVVALAEVSDGRLIAIDGKAIRRSFHKADGKAAIHMVGAWCETNHLVLGQVATDATSNEITAIPRLLEMLNVKEAAVTIDVIGCQKTIAKQIVEQSGDYVLQVKKNQPALHDLMEKTFDELTVRPIPGATCASHEEANGGHGRVETRRIWTTRWINWYPDRADWAGLGSLVCVERIRRVDGKTSTSRSYHISSLAGSVWNRFPTGWKPVPHPLGHIRGHWGIENRPHWSLDVSFREDTLRNRVGCSAETLSRMRR